MKNSCKKIISVILTVVLLLTAAPLSGFAGLDFDWLDFSTTSSALSFNEINRKWVKPPTFKLLWQKYVWGNRQKIFVWELKNKQKKNKA